MRAFCFLSFYCPRFFKYTFKYTAGAIILDDFLIEQAKLTSRSNGPPTTYLKRFLIASFRGDAQEKLSATACGYLLQNAGLY
ncbi:hypothetical protein PviCFBP13515_15935 [Pseudomonas viridiflava]|nr:hypothetical protein PviCFBP13507_24545 [Pseudomonas viridiflava]TKK25776.1 hypothetical protein PviCFBP13515_15935 [Pseudomonas viridiflava]